MQSIYFKFIILLINCSRINQRVIIDRGMTYPHLNHITLNRILVFLKRIKSEVQLEDRIQMTAKAGQQELRMIVLLLWSKEIAVQLCLIDLTTLKDTIITALSLNKMMMLPDFPFQSR